MNIPRYWASAEGEAESAGGAIPVKCWRWSDASYDTALEAARTALAQLVQRLAAGQPFPDRYGYASRPLREEVVSEHRDAEGTLSAVVTRNGYGCLVLNAVRVMFIDVDLPAGKPAGGFARLVGWLLGRGSRGSAGAEMEKAAIERTREWAAAHPGWGFRVYRTYAGLRLMETTRHCDPCSDEAASVMRQLGCDPLYLKLCKAQGSFRARLTPKPWRCGMGVPPGKWPYESSQARHSMQKWLDAYARASGSACACRLVATIGSSQVHPEAALLVSLHDSHSCAGAKAALA